MTVWAVPTFAELLSTYIVRSGITDAELARSVGVRRQTIFRWREGIVKRPRYAEDVVRIADRLRLTATERNQLLIAAGFPPSAVPTPAVDAAPDPGHAVAAGDVAARPLPTGAASSVGDAAPMALTRTDRSTWLRVALVAVSALGLFIVLWVRFGRTPSPNPPPTPMPTATTVPVVRAATGETLLLVSEFANYTPDQAYNVAGRVREALADEIAAAALEQTRAARWPAVIADEGTARRALAESAASMIIWGEYDSGRVRVIFTLPGGGEGPGWVQLLSSPEDLSATINVDVPRETKVLALQSLGRLYREREDYGAARAAFRHALALNPGEQTTVATLHFLLATVLERGDDADLTGAIAEYSRVLPMRPDWVNARYNRGRAYLQSYFEGGDMALLDAAIADFGWAVDQQPKFVDARLNRGIAYYARNRPGDLQAAYDDMTAAIALDADDYRHYYNRGLVNIRRNDSEWQRDLANALQLNPGHAASEGALCWGHALDRLPEQALDHCQRAVELGADGSIHDSVGIALAVQGRPDEAVVELLAYLDWLRAQPQALYDRYNGPLVEGWIAELEAGDMPFDAEMLKYLRQ